MKLYFEDTMDVFGRDSSKWVATSDLGDLVAYGPTPLVAVTRMVELLEKELANSVIAHEFDISRPAVSNQVTTTSERAGT